MNYNRRKLKLQMRLVCKKTIFRYMHSIIDGAGC